MLDLRGQYCLYRARISLGDLLETTRANTHDDQTDREASNGATGSGDDIRDGGNDQNSMADQCHCDRCENSAETTPILISNPGTGEGHDVGPKLVDYDGQHSQHSSKINAASFVFEVRKLTQGQSSRSTLSHTQSTGDAVQKVGLERTAGGAIWQWALNKVDNCVHC